MKERQLRNLNKGDKIEIYFSKQFMQTLCVKDYIKNVRQVVYFVSEGRGKIRGKYIEVCESLYKHSNGDLYPQNLILYNLKHLRNISKLNELKEEKDLSGLKLGDMIEFYFNNEKHTAYFVCNSNKEFSKSIVDTCELLHEKKNKELIANSVISYDCNELEKIVKLIYGK